VPARGVRSLHRHRRLQGRRPAPGLSRHRWSLRSPQRIAESGAPAERTDEGVPGDDAASQAAPAPSEPEPVSIRDLPDRIQRRIPTLEFATHIFGDAPRYREVTINGRRYAEGERVEGMLLSEITETGVVFDFEGYRFEMSVLDDWDY
jgi:general secretion pathway protein B